MHSKPLVIGLSLISWLILFFPIGSHAQDYVRVYLRGGNAEDLVNHCAGVVRMEGKDAPAKDAPGLSYCFGYISGVVDMRNTLNAFSSSSNAATFCVPDDASITQLAKIVVKYGNDHPEGLNRPALSFVTDALIQSFRCK
jgi:hypothetical protein